MKAHRFLSQEKCEKNVGPPPNPGNQHCILFRTTVHIRVWDFLEHLGKIISVPFLKVAISGGKVGRPSNPCISGKSGMLGSISAKIGCLNTILS